MQKVCPRSAKLVKTREKTKREKVWSFRETAVSFSVTPQLSLALHLLQTEHVH